MSDNKGDKNDIHYHFHWILGLFIEPKYAELVGYRCYWVELFLQALAEIVRIHTALSANLWGGWLCLFDLEDNFLSTVYCIHAYICVHGTYIHHIVSPRQAVVEGLQMKTRLLPQHLWFGDRWFLYINIYTYSNLNDNENDCQYCYVWCCIGRTGKSWFF